MVYIFFFFLLLLFSAIAAKNEKHDKKLFSISILLLLCLTCLRSRFVGIDTSGGYYSYYKQIGAGLDLSWLEPLWVLLNKVSLWLGWGYSGVIGIAGALTILPVAFVVSHECRNKCFGIFIYYGMYMILFSFNMVRQSIAVSVCLLAMYLFLHKKNAKAVICIIIAFLFHNSSIIVLPIILWVKIHWSLYRTILILSLSFVIGTIANSSFFTFFSGQYADDLLRGGGYYGFRESITMPALFTIGFNILFIILVMCEYGKAKKDPWFLIAMLGVVVMNLTYRLGQGTRIVLFFSQAQVVFFSNYIDNMERKGNKRIVCFLYVAYLFANFYRILISQWDSLVPYSFFWQV